MLFHIGQLLAEVGRDHYEQAIKSFGHSFHEDKKDPWNYYVSATIGFLEGDLSKINQSLHLIEAVSDENPHKLSGNHAVVLRLKKGLESGITDYKTAYVMPIINSVGF